MDTTSTELPPCVLWPHTRCPAARRDEALRQASEAKVFMNIPYTAAYAELEIAMWVAIKLHGLIPVVARDIVEDASRLCNITHLVWQCKYGISDFSTASMNVAMEDMGLRKQGLQTIAVAANRWEFTRDVSNLLPVDPVTHDQDPKLLIAGLGRKIHQNWRMPRTVASRDAWQIFDTLLERYRERGYGYILEFYEEAEPLFQTACASARERAGTSP